MKRYIPILFIALASLSAATSLRAEPAEGYILTPDKVRIFYKIVGKGPETLVAVHGGPGNSLESIRPDLEPSAKGRRVIFYDQRGQGRSELIKDGKKLAYEKHVADLEALRQHFKLDKITLLGNSWGGLLVSLYAVAHPDRVERMVLHSPASPTKALLNEMDDEILRRMSKIYSPEKIERTKVAVRPETWLKASDPIAVCREAYTAILTVYTYSQTLDTRFKGDVCAGLKESVRLQRTVNAHMWRSLGEYDLMPKLAVVKAPVLVIHGTADVIPQRSSELWASSYPNARLLLIQRSGHMPQSETPEIFFPAVETFLKGTFPTEAKRSNRPGNKARLMSPR